MTLRKIDPFVLVTGAVYFFLAWYAYDFYHRGGLLPVHFIYARKIACSDYLILHPGLFWLNHLVGYLTSLDLAVSFYALITLHVPLILCASIWAIQVHAPRDTNAYLILACALMVMFASAIGLPGMHPKIYNFTYNNRPFFLLRNTTHMVMLPYAIAAFGLFCLVLKEAMEKAVVAKWPAIGSGVLLFVSALIKPSFAIAFIPACGLYIIFKYRLFSISTIAKLFCILIPTGLLIMAQFYVGFIDNPVSGPHLRFSLKPWVVWYNNNKYPFLFFLLVTAFPLWILLFRARRLTSATIIAWLSMAIALGPYILLHGVIDRDFEWSYLHTRQIVFLCSAFELLRWIRESGVSLGRKPPYIRPVHVAGLLLAAHFAFGVARAVLVDYPEKTVTLKPYAAARVWFEMSLPSCY